MVRPRLDGVKSGRCDEARVGYKERLRCTMGQSPLSAHKQTLLLRVHQQHSSTTVKSVLGCAVVLEGCLSRGEVGSHTLVPSQPQQVVDAEEEARTPQRRGNGPEARRAVRQRSPAAGALSKVKDSSSLRPYVLGIHGGDP